MVLKVLENLQGVQAVTQWGLELLYNIEVFICSAKYLAQTTSRLWKIYLDLTFINYYSEEWPDTYIDSHRPIVTQ